MRALRNLFWFVKTMVLKTRQLGGRGSWLGSWLLPYFGIFERDIYNILRFEFGLMLVIP